jgi:hypothetical protein
MTKHKEKRRCRYDVKVPVEQPLCEEDGLATSWLVKAFDRKVELCFISTYSLVVACLSVVFIIKTDKRPVILANPLAR